MGPDHRHAVSNTVLAPDLFSVQWRPIDANIETENPIGHAHTFSSRRLCKTRRRLPCRVLSVIFASQRLHLIPGRRTQFAVVVQVQRRIQAFPL